MTNRQSNIIFYSVISIIIYALILNYTNPEVFENLSKSKEEISIDEAINKGEHNKALAIYQELLTKRISDNNQNTVETATMLENMAHLYSTLGNQKEEKNHYLKSIQIKEQLKKSNVLGLAKNYDKLGSIAEEELEYDQAQMYYEKSLAKKLGSTQEEDQGMLVGMQNTREQYLRLNNAETIATFKKLGEIHKFKKEYAIAKKYYEKALTASKLTFGEDDANTIEIMQLMDKIVP